MESEPDIEADISAVVDRGESLGLMEPVVLAEDCRSRGLLNDLAFELGQKSAGFRRSLPPSLVPSLASLVRSMNCYYSNLIEGHDTHPIDIERALKNDYSADPKKRDLQIEAKAHIAVQTWIDGGALARRSLSVDGICEIHRRFYENLPDALCWATNRVSGERVRIIPGRLRHRDVRIGKHDGISPGAVPRFLQRFEAAFAQQGKAGLIVAAAAAHHRLAWIHPFLDGNGRVTRLMSHALYLDLLDTGGLWSIARGLGRHARDYKMHLANCDQLRRNDLDGRGTLSEAALVEFTEFYLRLSLDQVNFMETMMQPDRLRVRVMLWAEEEKRLGKLPHQALTLLEALLHRGEVRRAEIAPMLGVVDRQARRIVNRLAERDVIVSESARSPLRLGFPAALASRWMPGLFPDKPVEETS